MARSVCVESMMSDVSVGWLPNCRYIGLKATRLPDKEALLQKIGGLKAALISATKKSSTSLD